MGALDTCIVGCKKNIRCGGMKRYKRLARCGQNTLRHILSLYGTPQVSLEAAGLYMEDSTDEHPDIQAMRLHGHRLTSVPPWPPRLSFSFPSFPPGNWTLPLGVCFLAAWFIDMSPQNTPTFPRMSHPIMATV